MSNKIGPYPIQENWFAIRDKLGGEKPACQELARQLRLIADSIEDGGCDPGVFGVQKILPIGATKIPCDMLIDFSITLSYPWGG